MDKLVRQLNCRTRRTEGGSTTATPTKRAMKEFGMDAITQFALRDDQAALWYLGQAGYIFRAAGRLVAIDPYLSDSAAGGDAGFAPQVPVPIQPGR